MRAILGRESSGCQHDTSSFDPISIDPPTRRVQAGMMWYEGNSCPSRTCVPMPGKESCLATDVTEFVE